MPRLLGSIFSVRRRGIDGSAAVGERQQTICPASIGVLLGLAFFATYLRTHLGRFVVVGPSMTPTLTDGDHLVTLRSQRLRRDDLVVFTDPTEPSRQLVKRVVGFGADDVVVIGDNEGASRDSRAFGAVPRSSITGVVRYRYLPANRAGRLARPTVARAKKDGSAEISEELFD